jgi:hypothetical protein
MLKVNRFEKVGGYIDLVGPWRVGRNGGRQTRDVSNRMRILRRAREFRDRSPSGTTEARTARKVLNYDTLKCGHCGNLMFAFWSAAAMSMGGRGIHQYHLCRGIEARQATRPTGPRMWATTG